MLWAGDLGHVGDAGYLYLTGRSSEVIVRGGVNIYPAEVENALMGTDGVEDVAVFGVPDSGDLGESVAAHLVPLLGQHASEQFQGLDVCAQADRNIAARIGFRVRILDHDRRDGRTETRIAAQLRIAGNGHNRTRGQPRIAG